MTATHDSRFKLVGWSAAAGFVAGGAVMAALVVIGERRGHSPQPTVEIQPADPMKPPAVMPPPGRRSDATPMLATDPAADLKQRRLELPVQGASRDALRDSFSELRGGTRKHEAIDILAPLNTPVVAVEDGTIAKLFRSDAGGITVYQFDPSATYVYYYAHLDHYAAGLAEGGRLVRGQVIGYVGVSGNAPKDTPHLHFAIFKLTAERKWWQGTAVDPYAVLK